MNTDNKDLSVCCANCGKGEEESSSLKACAACKMIKYCSRDCQIAHRPQHKKECKRRAKEMHDEELFKQPPPAEDCPICFERMPTLRPTGSKYQTCCGKVICSGCMHAPVYDSQGNKVAEDKCPFCRAPTPNSQKEHVRRQQRRMKAGDAKAIHNFGCFHRDGTDGCVQSYTKALGLWHRAVELGYFNAYCNIGTAYLHGRGGVEVDKKKAIHYYELAAMKGNVVARHNLGVLDMNACNMVRAVKHFLIAVRSGYTDSLGNIKQLYLNGIATKDDYTKALQYYQEYLGEIKSRQRDEAAAFTDEYRYY